MFLKSLPNIITLSTISCGISAMFSAVEGFMQASLFLLMAAAVLDTLDGFVARRLGVASELGAELDSLCDAINFGAVPAFLFYWWALLHLPAVYFIAPIFFVICVVLRLAIFNIRARCYKESTFKGIPSPAAALLLLLPITISFALDEINFPLFSFLNNPIFLSIWAFIIAFSMICPLSSPSFKNISVKEKSFLLITLSMLVFLSFIFKSAYLFLGLALSIYFTYVCLLWLISLFKKEDVKKKIQ